MGMSAKHNGKRKRGPRQMLSSPSSSYNVLHRCVRLRWRTLAEPSSHPAIDTHSSDTKMPLGHVG